MPPSIAPPGTGPRDRGRPLGHGPPTSPPPPQRNWGGGMPPRPWGWLSTAPPPPPRTRGIGVICAPSPATGVAVALGSWTGGLWGMAGRARGPMPPPPSGGTTCNRALRHTGGEAQEGPSTATALAGRAPRGGGGALHVSGLAHGTPQRGRHRGCGGGTTRVRHRVLITGVGENVCTVSSKGVGGGGGATQDREGSAEG